MVEQQNTVEKVDSSFDPELSTELEELEYYGNGATVDIEITSVERDDDTVVVEFNPPAGSMFSKQWPMPKTLSDRSMFSALIDEVGYNLSSADQVIGERVPAVYTDDNEWEIQVTRPKPPVRQRVQSLMVDNFSYQMMKGLSWGGGVIAYPIIFPFLFLWLIDQDDTSEESSLSVLYKLSFLLLIWFCVAAFFVILLGEIGGLVSGIE